MIEELVPDGRWERGAPLLPPKPRRYRHPGRRPIGDRAALAGIVVVLTTGITWNQLPTALVGCSGVTCGRRLRDWTEAGVWPALHELLLAQLRGRRLACPSTQRGDAVGPSPVDRGLPGSTHHLLCDAGGVPLAVSLTGGNHNDITQLIPLGDAVPPIRGRRGRPRRIVEALRCGGVMAHMARNGVYDFAVKVVLPDGRAALWDVTAVSIGGQVLREGCWSSMCPRRPWTAGWKSCASSTSLPRPIMTLTPAIPPLSIRRSRPRQLVCRRWP